MIDVVIVGDVRLYREGLALLLHTDADMDVVATAETFAEALSRIGELAPAIVLVDAAMPEAQAGVRAIHELAAEVGIVVLSVPDQEQAVLPYVEAGVAGFVTRDEDPQALRDTIHAVARGEALCSPRMAAALLRRVANLASERPPEIAFSRLTIREHEVVDLIAAGLSNKEIARGLCIEVATVKNHVHHILEKLDVRRRSDVVAALRN